MPCGGMWRHVRAPAEDACDVLGGLALADLDGVGAQVDGMPSQLEEALQPPYNTKSRCIQLLTASR